MYRKYKKIIFFLIYVHNSKTSSNKKRMEYFLISHLHQYFVYWTDDDDFLNSFHDINLGASLLFIWARISPEVADVANDVDELQSNPAKRWQAYGMLKHIVASGDLLWEFKRRTIEVLLDIVKGAAPSQCNEEIDCSHYTTSIYAALQA